MKKSVFLLFFSLSLTIISFSYGEWIIRRPMPHARYGAFVASVNNKLYVIGGMLNQNNAVPFVEEYNPVLDTWIPKAQMPTPRGLGVCGVVNGKIYCIGGMRSRTASVETVEVYDPVLNQWQRRKRVPMRYFGYNGDVIEDSIYLCGGFFPNTASYTDTTIVYCVSRDSWFVRQSMNNAKVDFGCVSTNNNLFTVGGQFYSNYLNINEKYSPLQNTWQIRDTLRIGRVGLVCAALNNSIYAIGGERHAGGRIIYSKVDIYQPSANTWIEGESLNIARSYAGAAIINNQIFVVGGITRNFNSTTSLEQYTPAGIEEASNQIVNLPRLSVKPNPFRQTVMLQLNGIGNNSSVVKIYDNAGKLVKTLKVDGPNGNIRWDRTDNNQRLLPPGVYFAEAEYNLGQKSQLIKLVVIK